MMDRGLPSRITGANRRPPWASTTGVALRLFPGLSHIGPLAAVAQLCHSATCEWSEPNRSPGGTI
jgi:hypothetical protein